MAEQRKPMTQPPPFPWKKGKQKGYTAFSLEVTVCQDDNGWVFSVHDAASEEDSQIISGLPNHGVEQIAYALLTEALRRELYVEVLLALTQDRELVSQWTTGDPPRKQEIEHMLTNACVSIITKTMGKMVPDLAKEVLTMMADDGRSSSNGS